MKRDVSIKADRKKYNKYLGLFLYLDNMTNYSIFVLNHFFVYIFMTINSFCNSVLQQFFLSFLTKAVFVFLLPTSLSLLGARRCEDGCRPSTPWSTCVSTHSPTLTFSMNGDMPHVPITTLAGIASLTDCECHIVMLQTQVFTVLLCLLSQC